MADPAAPLFPTSLHIPVDLFASRKHLGLTPGDLGFADSSGNLVYISHKISSTVKTLLDSTRKPLLSIHRHCKGSWEVLKGKGESETELIFKVRRTLNKFTTTELEVRLIPQNQTGTSDVGLKIRGSPFQKSCTIYRSDSIVAQTSLMYKLKQIYVGKSKFRLTIFPDGEKLILRDYVMALDIFGIRAVEIALLLQAYT